MKIALVTGASSGLGREFVRQIAEQGKVEEIWAIARRRDRLEALQSISAGPIRVLALDLTRPGDMEYLRNTLQDELPDIRILVNAAGMGRMGPMVDIPAKDNDAMIDLNCRAAVDVTDAAFPYLHPGSQILEICSTAGFQPIPGLNVYAATKAFLLSYTQTLHYELSPAGIHVTAVCPYWVKDTEFIGIAEKGGHGFRHYPLASRSQDVVRRALRDSALNLRVSTPGLVCTLHRAAAKVTPNLLCLPLADWLSHVCPSLTIRRNPLWKSANTSAPNAAASSMNRTGCRPPAGTSPKCLTSRTKSSSPSAAATAATPSCTARPAAKAGICWTF